MPYCTPTNVKQLIHTDKTNTEITQLIADADLDLDDRLNGAYMNDSIKRLCSMRLAAIVIAQSQRGVLKALIQIYYPKFDLSGSGTEILNRFQDKVRNEGELGVACPKCGQLHTLQPYVDLQGYIHTDPDIPIHRTPNGSNLFVCGCGNLITLQP